MKDYKIDIVYLWVDSSDKKWQKEKDKWFEKINNKKPLYKTAATKSRYRDNGELKYSLRSVAKYTPWINHIYIITGFNHIPKWLDTKNPKITIVPHEQIMPKNALPTFNATSIEMCIPNIPGLSEHFLLANDDMFFNKKFKPSFFYDKHGRAKIWYSRNQYDDSIPFEQWKPTLEGYTQTLALSANFIEKMFNKKLYNMRPSHGIDPYLKSSWIECANRPDIKKQIAKQVKNKFRTNDEIQRWTFNMYDFMTGRATFSRAKPFKCDRHKILNFIYNLIHYNKARKSNFYCSDAMYAKKCILKSPMFCINDSDYNTEETLNGNIKILEQLFPNPSPFEKKKSK